MRILRRAPIFFGCDKGVLKLLSTLLRQVRTEQKRNDSVHTESHRR